MKCTPLQLEQLHAAQASSLNERKGLISGDRHHNPFTEAAFQRWGEPIKGVNSLSVEANESRKRIIARQLDNQAQYMMQRAAGGSFNETFKDPRRKLFTEAASRVANAQALNERTTSADVATFTQQTLAFLLPVFENLFIDQIVDMRVMQGPTAFVHTVDYVQGSAGEYATGTSFQGNLDINYSDCPTECGDANEVDFKLTSVTVTAVCKRLQAKYCLPAQQDLASQYGQDLGGNVRGMMQMQMAREKQGEVLSELVAGAGSSSVWSQTIPAASVYLTLDPKVYASTLYDAIIDCDNEIFKSNDGYRGANFIVGDPDSLNILEKLKKFAITSRDAVPRAQAGTGDIDEFSNYFGMANRRYNLWKAPFFTPNTLLVGVKSDAEQEAGFIHATYVAMRDLGIFLDPSTAEFRTGFQTRYANQMLRAGLYCTVTITA